MLRDVVVVGASLAGLRACETLRTEGYDGTVTLVGAEDRLPYDRPPLSKKLLAGEWEPERIQLRKPEALASLGLDLRLGTRATALDVDRREVRLDTGERLGFGALVIATGSAPRRLRGQLDLPGVHVLRTLDDALALRAELAERKRVVVVGAGFIGSEVAATAKGLGCEVTILEALPVPLGRALGDEMGAACAVLHRDHGVELRTGIEVEAMHGDGRLEWVELAGGTALEAEVVVVGIGVTPVTAWLEGSGLRLRDGVVCDGALRAGPTGVVAAGDVCRWDHPLFGDHVRVEHWTNAAEQGAHAARTLLAEAAGGAPDAYSAVPFFWSDQYGARIQFLGRAAGHDEVRVVLGSPEERRFLALYRRQHRLLGVLGLGLPRQLMSFTPLLARRGSWVEALDRAAALAPPL